MSGRVNLALSWRQTFHILGKAGLVITPVAIVAVYEPKDVRIKRTERIGKVNILHLGKLYEGTIKYNLLIL